jgi:hypothetical protein
MVFLDYLFNCIYILEDESFQITNFLNGYIDHEINLNQDGSCWNSCEDFKWTRNYRCSDGTFCDQQRKIGNTAACDGTVVDCSYIDSGMTICPSVRLDRIVNYTFFRIYSCRLIEIRIDGMTTSISVRVGILDGTFVLPKSIKFHRGGIYS